MAVAKTSANTASTAKSTLTEGTVIENGYIVITLPVNKVPKPSASGKSKIIATTSGFKDAGIEYAGLDVSISVNVIGK